MISRRGSSWCMRPACAEFGRSIFWIGGPVHHCPDCRFKTLDIAETTRSTGPGPYRRVEVEFNYDPHSQAYRDTAIVIDTGLRYSGDVFVVATPLVRTKQRALAVAEHTLARLQTPGRDAAGPALRGTAFQDTLDFDMTREEFAAKCRALGERLERSYLNVEKDPAPFEYTPW